MILELRITCRVIDSFNAYALPDRQAVAIAESLAEALHARLAATATGHPRD